MTNLETNSARSRLSLILAAAILVQTFLGGNGALGRNLPGDGNAWQLITMEKNISEGAANGTEKFPAVESGTCPVETCPVEASPTEQGMYDGQSREEFSRPMAHGQNAEEINARETKNASEGEKFPRVRSGTRPIEYGEHEKRHYKEFLKLMAYGRNAEEINAREAKNALEGEKFPRVGSGTRPIEWGVYDGRRHREILDLLNYERNVREINSEKTENAARKTPTGIKELLETYRLEANGKLTIETKESSGAAGEVDKSLEAWLNDRLGVDRVKAIETKESSVAPSGGVTEKEAEESQGTNSSTREETAPAAGERKKDDSSKLKLQERDGRITSISIGNARTIFSDLAALARANGNKKLWTAVSYARLGHGESASKTNARSLRIGYSPLAADSSRSLAVIVSIDKSGTFLKKKNGGALRGKLTSTGASIALRGAASGIASYANLSTNALLYYGYGYNKAGPRRSVSRGRGSFNSHSLGLALGLDYKIELGQTYSLVPTLTIDYLRSSLGERKGGFSSLSLSSVAINYGLEGTMALTKLLELTLGLGYSQMIALGSHRDLYRDRDSLNLSLKLAGRLEGGNRLALALTYRTAEGAAGPVAVFQKGFSSLGRFGIGLEWSL
ncbi:MAG: autotransporter outer membrane beta-barrel domain-containing protein [Rickettsiales bacterium]|jgi:hypothetical protein|nr:autotransporter outer membrane beta-barrel domain-containing protein [Rickettsiales bacterium]